MAHIGVDRGTIVLYTTRRSRVLTALLTWITKKIPDLTRLGIFVLEEKNYRRIVYLRWEIDGFLLTLLNLRFDFGLRVVVLAGGLYCDRLAGGF